MHTLALAATLAVLSEAQSFPTTMAAAEAVARGGDDARAAVEALKSKGKPGLWTLNDLAKKRQGAERARLVEAMGSLGLADAEWPLRQALKDGSAEVRAGAVRGLGHLKSDRVLSALLQSAAAFSPLERDAAVDALIELGPKAEHKARTLIDDKDPRARASALLYHARRRDLAGTDDALVAGLRDPDRDVRIAAIQLAAERGSQARSRDLEAAARDRDATVARAAVQALAKMWPPDAARQLAALAADPSLPELVWREAFAGLRSAGARGFPGVATTLVTSGETRRAVLKASLLADISDEEIGAALELLGDGRPDHADLARTILDSVGTRGEDAAIARLGSATPYSREVIIRWLKARAGERMGPKLLSAARSGDPVARAGAISTAASISGAAVLDQLLAYTVDPAKEVRAAAFRAIGPIWDLKVEDALETGSKDPEVNVRLAVLDACAMRHTSRRAEISIRALEDQNDTVRRAAIHALSGTRDPKALAALRARLATAPPGDRVPIVQAIAKSQLPQAASMIVELVTDTDPEIRGAALRVVNEQ